MKTNPCPLCGYHAPESACPHCRLAPAAPSLAAAPARRGMGWLEGLRALPMGFFLLAMTPRVKRLLIPPFVLTITVFALVVSWAWSAIERFFEAARAQSIAALELEPGWTRDALQWLLERGVVIALAKAGGLIVFIVMSSFIALWTFSIVYEALAGPFLDEIQSRIETRWFGSDPWKASERPSALPVARCAQLTWLASIAALALIALWWFEATPHAWIWLVCAPLPFVITALVQREWGRWFAWALAAQLRTLFVSFKASAFAGVLLLAFFWVKFIPFIGYFLFAGLAGFCTAVSLFDIPFSRRRFTLRQRLRFMFAHASAVIAYGFVTSLLFVIPFAGPLLAVPAASVGGLWLLCRLDKNALRPRAQRIERASSSE